MLIVSRVCAEFRDRTGKIVFIVRPQDLLAMMEAPEEIKEDPLFYMMLADRSMEAVETVEQQKALESDPVAGTNAEGRKPAADSDSGNPEAEPAPVKTTRKKSAKSAEAKPIEEAPAGGTSAGEVPAGENPTEPPVDVEPAK